jgi:hypothetical protein
MRPRAIALAVLALISTRVEAQSDSALTRALTDTTSLLGRLSQPRKVAELAKVEVRAVRLASASGGFMFGIVLGGFAGHEIRNENCRTNCRTATGDALLTGAVIGGTIGAGLGAAFLKLRSSCSFDRRIVRTMAGAVVGAAALFAAGGGLEKRRGRSAFFVPIGAIGGSLGTLGPCWKMRF